MEPFHLIISGLLSKFIAVLASTTVPRTMVLQSTRPPPPPPRTRSNRSGCKWPLLKQAKYAVFYIFALECLKTHTSGSYQVCHNIISHNLRERLLF